MVDPDKIDDNKFAFRISDSNLRVIGGIEPIYRDTALNYAIELLKRDPLYLNFLNKSKEEVKDISQVAMVQQANQGLAVQAQPSSPMMAQPLQMSGPVTESANSPKSHSNQSKVSVSWDKGVF